MVKSFCLVGEFTLHIKVCWGSGAGGHKHLHLLVFLNVKHNVLSANKQQQLKADLSRCAVDLNS